MKNYRVWEANRKVLFYPERWIEPELRRDKSPAFVRLESELQQGEIDADKAEQAFRGYLGQLDQVARLETVATCVQRVGGREIRHVFGRTFNTPTSYFYRRRVDSLWDPWQPVDLDIEGDHLLPVVWEERLLLFWLKFQEQGVEPATIKQSDTAVKPNKRWMVQLVWSERRDGKWTAASLLDPPHPAERTDRSWAEEYFLAPLPDGDGLTIAIGYTTPSGTTPTYTWKLATLPRGRGRMALAARGAWNIPATPFGQYTPHTLLSFNSLKKWTPVPRRRFRYSPRRPPSARPSRPSRSSPNGRHPGPLPADFSGPAGDRRKGVARCPGDVLGPGLLLLLRPPQDVLASR